jgi:hypothetical protein
MQQPVSQLRIALIPGRLDEQRNRLTQRALDLFFRASLDGNVEGEADRLPLARPPLSETDEGPEPKSPLSIAAPSIKSS